MACQGKTHPTATVPPPVAETKPGQLTQEQIENYCRDGYLIVENYFTREELQPCLAGVAGMVDELANKLHKAGKISNLHEEADVFKRLTLLDKEWPGAFVLFFKMGKFHESIGTLWSSNKLVNMMEQLIGPVVAGHPTWNLRPKVPKNDGTVVPWHQDAGYFSSDSYNHHIVTAWIPFLDTHAGNGGMQVVKGVHSKGICAKHTCCPGDTWYIDLAEEEIAKTLGANMETDVITCNVPFGGMLLFNQMTPHRSLPNTSDDVRWSIDLRWQSPYETWGFYGIQDGVLFRDPDKPNLEIDWKTFLSVNRKEVWTKKFYKEGSGKSDEFDTVVTGPWLGRWEVTHDNKHTAAFQKSLK